MLFNLNNRGDLEDRSLFLLTFQPVIPFKATATWNVIARFIMPIESVTGPGEPRYSGIGDMPTQFFVPKRSTNSTTSGTQI